LALIHEIDDEGRPISEAEKSRFAAYAKRGKREVSKTMEAEGGPKRHVPRRKKKRTEETPKDEPAAYPKPDSGPDTATTQGASSGPNESRGEPKKQEQECRVSPRSSNS